jgi:restriction endonuclease S subunit
MVRLGDVCPEDKTTINGKGSVLPYLGLEMIESETGVIDWSASTVEGISTCYSFDTRHILYGKLRPYLNKVALPDIAGRCSTEIIPLLPKEGICREYVAYFLRRPETAAYVTPENTGSRMPRADVSHLLKMKIPLPPLAEQRRIAAEIERQLATVDKAKKAAEAQLEAARALDMAYLHGVFEGKNWSQVRLGDVCSLINGDAYKDTDWSSKGIPIIRIQNLNDIHKPFNYWCGSLEGKVAVSNGDLLLAWSGTPGTSFGAHIWNRGEAVLNQHIFRVVTTTESIYKPFLKYAVNQVLDDMIDKAHGAVGLRHITKFETENLRIVHPPLAEQRRIAAEIERQLAAVDNTKIVIKAQYETICAMPAAILRQAFSGQI